MPSTVGRMAEPGLGEGPSPQPTARGGHGSRGSSPGRQGFLVADEVKGTIRGQPPNCCSAPLGRQLIILRRKETRVHYCNELWAKYFMEFDKPVTPGGPARSPTRRGANWRGLLSLCRLRAALICACKVPL